MWGDTFNESGVDEGWKSALAGAALAGSMALGGGGAAHAGEPVVGQGQSQNMQMAVDMAKHNAKIKYLKSVHGDNFQDKQMPEYRFGKLDLKSNDKGGYIATVPLIVDSEVQNETIRKIDNQYRLLSKKGKNLGTFDTKAGAEKHEREVQYFKHVSEETLEEDIERHLLQMRRAGYDIVQEEWSDKYKRSINCSNPKGFSQKAHCAGRKKNEDVAEARGDTNFGSTVSHGSWVVYDGSKVKRFKTRDGAKAYAEKNGGKVASSEFYADNIQGKQGVAEEKVRLDPKCWSGKKIGNPKTKMKGGVRVNNCVPK
jgi:hypothetical protein